MPEDKSIEDMTLLELLANQVDQELIEQAQRANDKQKP
jgi:hypothetical protein